jgi:superfamily II DNA/RNA helicase
MKNPLLIDLVGTDTNQIPERIKNICVLCDSDKKRHAVVRDYILRNKDKKILIFAETKKDCQNFGGLAYAKFTPIHGDLAQNQR